jgi:hypothetical protein
VLDRRSLAAFRRSWQLQAGLLGSLQKIVIDIKEIEREVG